MKIFKSLNCEFCEAPFTSKVNQSRPPRRLKCGKLMCRECLLTERSKKKEERKHQCENGDECFQHRDSKVHFLIDVLSQDSLQLSPMNHGYLLCKPFKPPKCPICHDEYSSTLEGKSPFYLWCNHITCTSCYEKTRTERSDKDRWKYEIQCPICSVITLTKANKLEEHCQALLLDFLAELPEMTRQLEEVGTTAYLFCKECKREKLIEDMCYCEGCEKNLCAMCVVKNHLTHKFFAVLMKEATKISEELQELSIKEINTYLDLPKELVRDIETFRTKLLSKEENLKQASNYEDLQKEHEKCIQLKTDFKATCEECMPHLSEFDTRVKNLIKSLDDDTN